jgi:hypothetical protein
MERPVSYLMTTRIVFVGWFVSIVQMRLCSLLSESIPCVALYEDSACAGVTLEMETASQIVSRVLDCLS